MRMRRKVNLDERMADCALVCIKPDFVDRHFESVDKSQLLDFEQIFGNKNPVVLEVGCGRGRFARQFALKNPNLNILAVEKYENVLVEACEKAMEQNIPNLKFLMSGAEYLLRYILENSISFVYLNFSTPFQKKSYADHRLTSKRFLNIYKKLMTPNAEIYQKTDDMHLFEFSLEQFACNGFGLKNVSLDLHSSDFEGNILTEYEEKFVKNGCPIYRLEAFLL